jgi:hypothetical protein
MSFDETKFDTKANVHLKGMILSGKEFEVRVYKDFTMSLDRCE